MEEGSLTEGPGVLELGELETFGRGHPHVESTWRECGIRAIDNQRYYTCTKIFRKLPFEGF